MEVEHKRLRRCDLFRVQGRVDSSNAQEFQNALFEVIDDGRCHLVINLSGLTYISSGGLRALIAALKSCQSRFSSDSGVHLAEVPAHIKEVFDLAGLTPLFAFYDSETEAAADY